MNDSNSSYAGRWVAMVRGRIIAQGGTPQQALQASQLTRHKEKAEIVYMPHTFYFHPLVDEIKRILPADQELYLVGGAVRDMLLNRLATDLDFAVPSNGISFARKVASELNAEFFVLDIERDTGRVIFIQENGTRVFLDFAAYRAGDTLEADLQARDFTINAIAYDLRNEAILDPLDGAQDVRAKIVRTCSPSSISDDPVRILRAIRQAAAFDFHIDIGTRAELKEGASGLARISPERLRDEIFKILQGPRPESSIRALEMLGVFPYVLPELTALKGVEQSLPHIYDVWTHTLAALTSLDEILLALRIGSDSESPHDTLMDLLPLRLGRYREQFISHFSNSLNPDRSIRSLLFFALLYHDVSKPETKTVDSTGRIRFFDHEVKGADVAAERARRLNLSNLEIERLYAIIKNHMRIHFFATRLETENQPPSRKAIYRFFRDSGEAGIDIILHTLADLRATQARNLTQETWMAYLDVARILLENYWERPQEVVAPPRFLDGNELMQELDLQPGPLIGQLLEAIRENQAAGKIENKIQALAFAREEMEKYK